jgi:hypothetical protein
MNREDNNTREWVGKCGKRMTLESQVDIIFVVRIYALVTEIVTNTNCIITVCVMYIKRKHGR